MFVPFVWSFALQLVAVPAPHTPQPVFVYCPPAEFSCTAKSAAAGERRVCFDGRFNLEAASTPSRIEALQADARDCALFVLARTQVKIDDFYDNIMKDDPLDEHWVWGSMERDYDVFAKDLGVLGVIHTSFNTSDTIFLEMTIRTADKFDAWPLRIFQSTAVFGLYRSYYAWLTGPRVATSASCTDLVGMPCMSLAAPTSSAETSMLQASMALHLRTFQ